MNVLIVDDSLAMRMIVTRTLEQAELEIERLEEATNGLEALEAIRRHEPDVVLSDWDMPEKSGIELLEDLRAAGCQVKFGFVTSEGTTAMKRRAKKSGASFFATKPFRAKTMRTLLEKAMS